MILSHVLLSPVIPVITMGDGPKVGAFAPLGAILTPIGRMASSRHMSIWGMIDS